jgi:hypothetical protein
MKGCMEYKRLRRRDDYISKEGSKAGGNQSRMYHAHKWVEDHIRLRSRTMELNQFPSSLTIISFPLHVSNAPRFNVYFRFMLAIAPTRNMCSNSSYSALELLSD